jgi:hypothetical protein
MKNKAIVLTVLFVLVIIAASCASSKKVCPAYSQQTTEITHPAV